MTPRLYVYIGTFLTMNIARDKKMYVRYSFLLIIASIFMGVCYGYFLLYCVLHKLFFNAKIVRTTSREIHVIIMMNESVA